MSKWLALAELDPLDSQSSDISTKRDKTHPEEETYGFVTMCHVSPRSAGPGGVHLGRLGNSLTIIEVPFAGSVEGTEKPPVRNQVQGNVVRFPTSSAKGREVGAKGV